jgi:hypothetical protein
MLGPASTVGEKMVRVVLPGDTVGNAWTELVAKTDYAANGGDFFLVPYSPGGGPDTVAGADSYPWPSMKYMSGIALLHGNIRMPDIGDGTSTTYLAGENCIDTMFYDSFWDLGYSQSAMTGGSIGNTRWGFQPPLMDDGAGGTCYT